MSSSDSSDSSFFSSFFSSSLAVEGKQDEVKSKMTTQTKFRRKEKSQFDFWGTLNLNLKEKLKSGTSPRLHSHYCYVTANVALGNALFSYLGRHQQWQYHLQQQRLQRGLRRQLQHCRSDCRCRCWTEPTKENSQVTSLYSHVQRLL